MDISFRIGNRMLAVAVLDTTSVMVAVNVLMIRLMDLEEKFIRGILIN
jgi:hypothetical protein